MQRQKLVTRILLSSASLAALATPAFAQDAGMTDEIVVTATGRAAEIQDVPLAVTAISGEAIENAGVQDVRDMEQLVPALRIATGQSNSAGTIARIRGIGTGGDNPGFETAVGIFIDGVYRARAGIALSDLPEVDRIEVLRGPQGTLFGRNTTAGAISIITAAPDFETHAWLEGALGLDDLEELGARAGLNIALTDTFALRFDGTMRGREGYITDVISGETINDRDRWTGRAQALWDISPDASLRVIVDGAGTDEACCGAVTLQNGLLFTPLVNGLTNVLYPVFGPNQGVLAANPEARRQSVSPGRNYGERVEEWGVSGELNWELNGINLTSITAYRDWETTRNQDIDFSLLDRAYRNGLVIGFETITQELRLQGEVGRLNWLVGAFYGDESLDTTDTIRFGADSALFANQAVRAITFAFTGVARQFYNFDGGVTPSFFGLANPAFNGSYLTPPVDGNGQQGDNWVVDTQSMSLFTHNQIDITEQLVLTVGARFNHETKDLEANLNSIAPQCNEIRFLDFITGGLTPGPGGIVVALEASPLGGVLSLACNPVVNTVANGAFAGDREENEWNGTASLAFHATDDLMIYGGYSRGYKAGGFNVDRSGFNITPSGFNAPNTSQLEFEPEFTDAYELGFKSTLFGGSTYFNANLFYEEIHDYQLNAFSGFNFITRNVGKLISQGVELDVLTRPTENLTLQGGVIYNDAYYDTPATFGSETIAAGTPLAGAPEWSVTGAFTYEVPLGNDLRALFYVDARWNSDYRVQTLNRAPGGLSDVEAFALVNGRVGIGHQDSGWSLELFGRNLTDEYYNVGAFAVPEQSVGTSSVLTNYAAFPNEPRTWGILLRARY